jgi:hypothetical protein
MVPCAAVLFFSAVPSAKLSYTPKPGGYPLGWDGHDDVSARQRRTDYRNARSGLAHPAALKRMK